MPDPTWGEPWFSTAYQLDKAELTQVFDQADTGRMSKRRLMVQSVLMAVVGGTSLYDYVTIQPRRSMSLFLAVAALAVGVAQWVVPALFRRSAVNRQLAENATVHLALFDKALGFGQGDGQMVFSFEECRVIPVDGMLIVRIGQEFVGIPDRVIGEDNRRLLTEQISAMDAI